MRSRSPSRNSPDRDTAIVRLALVLAVTVFAPAALASSRTGDEAAPSWSLPNGDLAGTRRAVGSAIGSGTVTRLERAWRFVLPEPPTFSGAIASTPLVLGDRIYLQTLRSNVYALDASSGRVVWSRRVSRKSGGPNGLAAEEGRLYGSTDTTVFALDARNGGIVWARTLTTARRPIDLAPGVSSGLVVTSTTAPYPGAEGVLYALDAKTGRVRWRRPTVAAPWADPKVASGGGSWWTPTFDSRGRVYAGISNPLPWGGTRAEPNGAAYAGDALYTDSLLVLEAKTGLIDWYDQVSPHDVRDYDFSLPPLLVRAGGRDLVIGGGKAGRVVAWDRSARRRVWSTSVGLHRNDTGPLPRRRVVVCPGLLGGVLTPMASAAGRVFVPVVDLCMRGSATGYENFNTIDYARGTGELVALDARDGKQLWARRLPSPNFGCATVASDVVFTSTYDGTVYALAVRSGRILWTAREPAGINACPAVAGDLLVVPAGAEPSTFATPVPVVDVYRLSKR